MATAEPVEQPKYGGILRIGHRADPPAAWDTMRSTNYNLTPIAVAIAGEGNLVQPCWDDEQMICPGFAESWEANDDFTEWTFTIRDGATWHDGVPFTAEDVRWWVDLFVNGTEVGGVMREPGVAKGQFGDFKSVEVLNGNQVRITLNSSDAFYLDSLALHRIPIFHARHVFEPAFQAGNLEAAPLELGNIAAGPFKFVSYETGVLYRVGALRRLLAAGRPRESTPVPRRARVLHIRRTPRLSMRRSARDDSTRELEAPGTTLPLNRFRNTGRAWETTCTSWSVPVAAAPAWVSTR